MPTSPKKPLRASGDRPLSPNCVTIFGAGIAGLTAAHELIERGFRVQIWEPVSDQRDPRRGLAVGGMARTQWGQVPWPEEMASLESELHQKSSPRGARAASGTAAAAPSAATMQRTQPIVPLLSKLYVLDPEEWQPGKIYAQERPIDDVEDARDDAIPLEEVIPVRKRAARGRGHAKVAKGTDEDQLEVQIVGFTALDPAQRHTRVSAVAAALGGLSSPLHFDVAAQLYKAELTTGTLFVPVREPVVTHPDTVAVINRWRNGQAAQFFFINPWEPGNIYGIDAAGNIEVKSVIRSLFQALYQTTYDAVYVEVTSRSEIQLPRQDRLRRVRAVHDKLKAEIKKDGALPGYRFEEAPPEFKNGWIRMTLNLTSEVLGVSPRPSTPDRKIILSFVQLADAANELPKHAVASIAFRPRERWLPGEHGHRFFPAFYHHLFDTMKRTPILETIEKPPLAQQQELAVGMSRASDLRYVETGKTAFENLRPTTSHALAFTGHRPSVLARTRIKSFQEFRELFKVFFSSEAEGGFDADPRDTSYFTVKLFQYLTSSPERRKDYEKMSWWDYIEGDNYGESFQRLLQKWPQALVAMNAESADARTNGTTTVQIMLDMVRDSGYRDGILAGPTNEAWLEHWRRYLEAQGVEFIQGRLEGFEKRTRNLKSVMWPKVSCFEPRHPLNENDEPELLDGYFLLAMPAHETARIAREYAEVAKPTPDLDLARAASIDTSRFFDDLGDPLPLQPEGKSEFRHYAGIQFYFEQDVLWLDGQVYHPNSAWGLTTVSQARFWDEKMDWEHGYRGVLSVIIADWNAPASCPGRPHSAALGKRARECSPQELAEEVWAQVKDGLQGPRPLVTRSRGGEFNDCPEPIYWHLDDNLQHDGTNYFNASPFHIQPPGRWAGLPGELDDAGYSVENGIVICGMFTKTHTRIPSMEAANESARHAVNAILRHSAYKETNTPCDIWDPENREIDDFAWLKEWDARLQARGQPHFIEIFGVDRLVRDGLRGGAQDPFDPVNLAWSFGRLSNLFRSNRNGGY
jgi:hypothetical protein